MSKAYLVSFGTGAQNYRVFEKLSHAQQFYVNMYRHLHQADEDPNYPLDICAMRPLEDTFGNGNQWLVQKGTNVYNRPEDCHCGKLERFSILAISLNEREDMDTN